MAGLNPHSPIPTSLTLHQQSLVLEVIFDNGRSFAIPFELMRIYSPSAEVKGHTPDQAVLQVGKHDVNIVDVKMVGNYAIQPIFSDGHDSGIYSWDLLYTLGDQADDLWRDYDARLKAAGVDRMGAPLGGAGTPISPTDNTPPDDNE